MCNSHDNRLRGPANALFFRAIDGFGNWLLRDRKQKLFAGLSGCVVEIGPGVGANLKFVGKSERYIAVEPSPHMAKALLNRARSLGISVEVVDATAEDTTLPDSCADYVICTLVLCTVSDQIRVLSEIRRILKSGGRFVFIEHVGAPHGSMLAWFQRRLKGPWRYVFEGCELDRQTETAIRQSGFNIVKIERYIQRGPFVPIRSQISGTASEMAYDQ